MSTDNRTWFKLEVKQEDIDGGICRDAEKCVLARAINRTLGDKGTEHAVVTDFDDTHLVFAELHGVVPLRFHNREAFRDYIKDFDNARKVEPTTFIVYAYDLSARVVDILRDKGLLLDGEPATT